MVYQKKKTTENEKTVDDIMYNLNQILGEVKKLELVRFLQKNKKDIRYISNRMKKAILSELGLREDQRFRMEEKTEHLKE